MARFDLSSVLEKRPPIFENVPESGTMGQIEYIDLSLIDSDPNNFYELSGIDELASNIALCGLQQPILVRQGENGRVTIVSGHRRRAALQKLVDEGGEKWKKAPCIRQKPVQSEALQELYLIYANSDTRKMTSGELSRQIERVEALLYQLKEEGQEFPGRMRDHVAKICQVSKTKIGNLKVIRENLTPKWKKAWEKGEVNEAVALTIARMPEEHQNLCWESAKNKTKLSWYYEGTAQREGEMLKKLDSLKCSDGIPCERKKEKFTIAKEKTWLGCQNKCCGKCSELASCKYACPKFAEEIKKLKAEKREENRKAQIEKEEKEAPTIDAIREMWRRFGEARRAAGLTVEEYHKVVGLYYSKSDDKQYETMESGEGKVTTYTTLPYGYSCQYYNPEKYKKAADALGVSLDYLLLRSPYPTGSAAKTQQIAAPAAPAQQSQDEWAVWACGEDELPNESGFYWCITGPMSGGGKLFWWNNDAQCWEHPGALAKLTPKVQAWIKCPDIPESISWNREVGW